MSSDHFDGRRFRNPWAPMALGPRDLLRWRLGPKTYSKRDQRPAPQVANDGASLAGHAAVPEITWIGHSSFALHDGPDVVLTDPHFGPRTLLPRRQVPPGIPLAAVPDHAFAVLSHAHYDHLDAWTVRRLPTSVDWYVPLGHARWFARRTRARVTELDWGESVRRGRWTLTLLPAQHWSNRLSLGRDRALWGAWLLASDRARYFFGGDSGWFEGFAEVGRAHPGIDVALLSIGAYEPRWFMRYQHLNPAEALAAFQALGARHFLPTHWGVFDLADDPLDLPPRELAAALAETSEEERRRVHLLAVGETWRLL